MLQRPTEENIYITRAWDSYEELKIDTDHHIWIISEGSCDTEDWSNDAKNSVLPHRNK